MIPCLMTIASLSFALSTGPASGPSPHSADTGRFVQDRFCIGLWVDPPADENMEEHYRLLAAAGFTVVLGGFGARTPAQIDRQLELCGRLGLKAVVWHGMNLEAERPDHPACWGYLLKDEPHARDFDALGRIVRRIRDERPGRLAFINLFPSLASTEQMGHASYEAYVEDFLARVPVDVLCFDRYPRMNPDADEREGYCADLAVIRRHALRAGIPFWNFFNIMPFGTHEDPTEAQVAWQIYTSLAYGARGVLYFCYWTPRGPEFPRGGAIISADGRPTRHYEQARRLNARIRALGPTLMKLTSTGVVRIRPGEKPAHLLGDGPLADITEGDWLVGLFRHAHGRRAVLLNNYRFAYTAWPTVTFAADPAAIVEVSQETGREVPLRDDSPDMPGVQISLDAGEGRLFLLPP